MNDFFDDKEIQKLQNIELEYDEDVEAAVNVLNTKLSIAAAPCPRIESFLLYKSLESAAVVETYKGTSGIFEIAFYEIQYSRFTGTKHSKLEYHRSFLGLLTLNKNYPQTCIFKENWQARINDWFTKQDVDFEQQKEFSRKFHVISSDKLKLQSFLSGRPLDELAAFGEMEAEIRGKYCLFKVSNDSASEYDAEQLIEVAGKLHKIFSGS